eukprot:TRINITY_DN244_c0_g1_i1.p1 TRINITY_DN244_c0_g1~~TRINITY_DN244_c0_g1_i1.p1  ORF type:complete len:310 (+),score=48.46 TRINITY_DN244_c0_g1_i1:166-1095(+)
MEKRRVHPRTKVDPRQQQILEEIFQKTHYPSAAFKTKISSQLSLPIKYLDIWFQNRRAKEKRLGDPKLKSEAHIFNSVFKCRPVSDTNFSNINLNFELFSNSKVSDTNTEDESVIENTIDKLWSTCEVTQSQQQRTSVSVPNSTAPTTNKSTTKLSISSLLNDEPTEQEGQSARCIPSPPPSTSTQSTTSFHATTLPSRPAPSQEELLTQLSSLARTQRAVKREVETESIEKNTDATSISPLIISRLSSFLGRASDNNSENSKSFHYTSSFQVYPKAYSSPIPSHVLSGLLHSSEVRPPRNSVNNLYFL